MAKDGSGDTRERRRAIAFCSLRAGEKNGDAVRALFVTVALPLFAQAPAATPRWPEDAST